MRATAVPRAGSGPVSPVYQESVFAGVPAMSDVAVLNGGPLTRCGGVLVKNSLDAFRAEAATSAPFASAPTAVVKAALRLAALAVLLAPIRYCPAFNGVVAEAVSWIFSVLPSGRLKAKVRVSPGLGLVAPRSSVSAGGEPVGPVSVTLGDDDKIDASFNPNGEPAASSAIEMDVAVGVAKTSRPVPVPRSAWLRSAISCFRPAWAPTPLRISSIEAVAGVSVARPENR